MVCSVVWLFPDLTFVICNAFAADHFDYIAELLDLGDKGIDVLFRNFKIGVVARFDVCALQQIEEPFFLRRVAREYFEDLRRVLFRRVHQLRQVMAFVTVKNKGHRYYTQQVFGRLMKMKRRMHELIFLKVKQSIL